MMMTISAAATDYHNGGCIQQSQLYLPISPTRVIWTAFTDLHSFSCNRYLQRWFPLHSLPSSTTMTGRIHWSPWYHLTQMYCNCWCINIFLKPKPESRIEKRMQELEPELESNGTYPSLANIYGLLFCRL